MNQTLRPLSNKLLVYLTQCDFYLWSFIKSKVYSTRLQNFEKLENQIGALLGKITSNLLENIKQEWAKRWLNRWLLHLGIIPLEKVNLTSYFRVLNFVVVYKTFP